ncbi:hypothetical protein A2U01_0065688, partial [Trifolium medium]|nr:hypothetical protein [Trifolium medium]
VTVIQSEFEILLCAPRHISPRNAPMPERNSVNSEWTAQRAIDSCATRTFQTRNSLLAI